MNQRTIFPRSIQTRLVQALEESPVVLIHGARQSGKTTLAQLTCAPTHLIGVDGDRALGHSWDDRKYSYFSFDDFVTRDAARSDPRGFVLTLPDYVILDEVQRVPELFEAIKIAVDLDRIPGRFLLAGSTNVLLVPQLSDSLAGRMRIVPLHPLTQYEISATSNPSHLDSGFFDSLFGNGFQIFQSEPLGARLVEKIVAGGFPAALAQPTLRGTADWYRDYLEAIIQRDVRDISRIRSLDVLPRLLSAAAAGTAQLFNLQSLAAPFELSRPSIGEYVTLLERLFLLSRLPAWHSNRLKRLVKRPKLHLGDTGLAASLLDAEVEVLKSERSLLGQLLETFVMQELQRQASWQDTRTKLFHLRDKDGVEVDIVLEQGPRAIAGVEIKLAATVSSRDFRGLRKLRDALGERFTSGVVLYDGEISVPFGDRLHAIPISRLWQSP